jgi:hypothetical protein
VVIVAKLRRFFFKMGRGAVLRRDEGRKVGTKDGFRWDKGTRGWGDKGKSEK